MPVSDGCGSRDTHNGLFFLRTPSSLVARLKNARKDNAYYVAKPQHGVATKYDSDKWIAHERTYSRQKHLFIQLIFITVLIYQNKFNIKVRLTPSFIEQKEKEVIFLIAQRTICQKIALPSIPLQPASSGRKYTLIILLFSLAFCFDFI